MSIRSKHTPAYKGMNARTHTHTHKTEFLCSYCRNGGKIKRFWQLEKKGGLCINRAQSADPAHTTQHCQFQDHRKREKEEGEGRGRGEYDGGGGGEEGVGPEEEGEVGEGATFLERRRSGGGGGERGFEVVRIINLEQENLQWTQ